MNNAVRDMSHAHTHEQLAEREPAKSGPMKMKTRQARYGKKLRGRFIKIRAEARRGIVERDIFGYDSPPGFTGQEQLADDFTPDTLTPSGYSPTDDPRNHDRFMQWLREQQRRGVLELISRDGNLYVRNAAADGVRWANARLREAGHNVADDTVESVFNAPQNANALRLLFQRNYELLDGLTSDVANSVSETLTRGFAQGLGPNAIAREIANDIDSIALRRATYIARNETMLAANRFTKLRYRNMGVQYVDVLGSSPCDKCKPYVRGGPYPIDDIPEGGPPFHIQCVGTLVPAAF